MSCHAPGPWRAGEPDERGHVLVTSPVGDVADVIAGPMTAAVVIEAPNMLAALKRWAILTRPHEPPCDCRGCETHSILRRLGETP